MWTILFGGLLFEFWSTAPCLCFTSYSYLMYHAVRFVAYLFQTDVTFVTECPLMHIIPGYKTVHF